MPTNYYMFFVAALIPMFVVFIYYSEPVMGKAWRNLNGFSKEDLQKGNPLGIFGGSYFLCLLLSLMVSSLVIHQGHTLQMMLPLGTSELPDDLKIAFMDLMSKYGDNHRTFKHGAIHGGFGAIFLALPLIGVNALFERKGWKYIMIHTLYWLITLTFMGGLLCATLKYAPLT